MFFLFLFRYVLARFPFFYFSELYFVWFALFENVLFQMFAFGLVPFQICHVSSCWGLSFFWCFLIRIVFFSFLFLFSIVFFMFVLLGIVLVQILPFQNCPLQSWFFSKLRRYGSVSVLCNMFIYIYICCARPWDASATSHQTNCTQRNHFSTFVQLIS